MEGTSYLLLVGVLPSRGQAFSKKTPDHAMDLLLENFLFFFVFVFNQFCVVFLVFLRVAGILGFREGGFIKS